MMRVADRIAVSPARAVTGELRVPGDKSISHRYALLAAIADGPSTISNYAPGADCASTLTCLEALGAIVSRTPAPVAADPRNRDRRGPRPARPGRTLRAARLRQFRQHHANAGRRHCRPPLHIDSYRRRITVAAPHAANYRAPDTNGGYRHCRPRRSSTRHHSRRPTRWHPLRSRHPQRPGEVGGAAGRAPGDWRDPCQRTRLYPGSYGTRLGGVRGRGHGGQPIDHPAVAANGCRDGRCACPATSPLPRSWPWLLRRWPAPT